MIRWIAANGKLDKPFLKQHTGAVYLVDKDGKLMREDAKDPNSYLVFDEKSQKLVRHDAKNIDPALEVKAGSPYRTVLSMVLEQAEPWTPEAVRIRQVFRRRRSSSWPRITRRINRQ